MADPAKSLLDRLEQASKVVGAIAVPLVVALFGWLIQRQLATQNLSRDYVQLAVSILKEPKKEDDQQLRQWAVDLLNAHSPVKLGESVSTKLQSGEISLPRADAGPSMSQALAEKWLALIDAGSYAEAWTQLGEPRRMSPQDFVALFEAQRRPLGMPVKRLLANIQTTPDPESGLAYQLIYITTFAKGQAFYEVVAMAPRLGGYRVLAHTLHPMNPPR
ncbi:DUF4019 domain-containing protein [uncultured Variovorax sp.]|uniref:DUF4019 domain-containing protein n=1 Tax=uncultured Variovorax sp. TaxID=114708 RepID=UPI0025EF3D4B|nr:DUF4019 domain-containing protein [uncultured Variovorax sp.]